MDLQVLKSPTSPKKRPDSPYKNRLINIIRPWKREQRITDRLYLRIYPTSEDTLRFYGLSNIHKKDAPLRPIVSSIFSMSFNIATFLA